MTLFDHHPGILKCGTCQHYEHWNDRDGQPSLCLLKLQAVLGRPNDKTRFTRRKSDLACSNHQPVE